MNVTRVETQLYSRWRGHQERFWPRLLSALPAVTRGLGCRVSGLVLRRRGRKLLRDHTSVRPSNPTKPPCSPRTVLRWQEADTQTHTRTYIQSVRGPHYIYIDRAEQGGQETDMQTQLR
jgi:hypothetical protein